MAASFSSDGRKQPVGQQSARDVHSWPLDTTRRRAMKKILVAVDGSEAAIHAARTAMELAEKFHGEVTLAYVVPQVLLPADVPFAAGKFAEEAVKAGEILLEQTAKELGQPGLRRVCLTGSPAERLTDLAEAENFDLIVVGSKGRGAVSRMLVGSTTDRLVHISRKPVLVVR
jgi:nucleotide-binding universal stress UspA family protein